MGNIGDHGKGGNISYDQQTARNTDQQRKRGIMNMNYHNTPNFSINIGTSTGMTTTSNETVGRKLNSSQDACPNEGVMLQFIHFFPFILSNPSHQADQAAYHAGNRTTT